MSAYRFPRSAAGDAAGDAAWSADLREAETLVGCVVVLPGDRRGLVDEIVERPGPGGYVGVAGVFCDDETDRFEEPVEDVSVCDRWQRDEADRLFARLLGTFAGYVGAPDATLARFVNVAGMKPDERSAFFGGRSAGVVSAAIGEIR